ncbi:MAG: hypothetical protein IGS03_08655 [Candidatus Sericytochromatia bacterium]|nr:hypothetical protein [Candidatus Sericytochromatia bacterium]
MPELSVHSEICYGPMKSGKSLFLIETSQQLLKQHHSFLSFKPVQDTRDGHFIRSRQPQSQHIQALAVASSQDLWRMIQQALQTPRTFFDKLPSLASPSATGSVLPLRQTFRCDSALRACLIDEVFLLDAELLKVLQRVMQAGVSVYLSGLDRDFRGEYFPLRQLGQDMLSMEDVIGFCQKKMAREARCESCGQPATLTQRLINGQPAPYDSPTVLIGDEEYQPRCSAHHQVLGASHLSAAS